MCAFSAQTLIRRKTHQFHTLQINWRTTETTAETVLGAADRRGWTRTASALHDAVLGNNTNRVNQPVSRLLM